jgi:hypothetical protein
MVAPRLLPLTCWTVSIAVLRVSIVADALAVASRNPPKWLQFRDNFVPKLLYWPTLMVLILAIAIGFFC